MINSFRVRRRLAPQGTTCPDIKVSSPKDSNLVVVDVYNPHLFETRRVVLKDEVLVVVWFLRSLRRGRRGDIWFRRTLVSHGSHLHPGPLPIPLGKLFPPSAPKKKLIT